jgi:hypothetical protein
VADRSFLTEILSLLLVAALVWPCSGVTARGKASDSASARFESSVAHAAVKARPHGDKSVPERRFSKFRGILDNDPAILCDDSADWVEGSTGFVAAYPAAPAHGSFSVPAPVAGMIAGPSPVQAAPIQFLCRYQC